MLNPEKIEHENLTDLSISPVRCSQMLHRNLLKLKLLKLNFAELYFTI